MSSTYYGSIPLPIRHHKDLKPISKLLYAEITSTLNEQGKCIKRNAHFVKALHISISTVNSALKELREYGFIHVQIDVEKQTHKFIKRFITPIPTYISEGVRQSSNFTHADNLNGVSDSSPLKDLEMPSGILATLLYNNNTIVTNKIEPNIRHTQLNDSINDKQLEYIQNIVNHFYDRQSKKFPHLYSDWKSDDDLINKSINMIYDLIRLDKVDYKLIKDVIYWALQDRFWHKNLISLKTLRKKSDNGFTKWNNLLTKYRSQAQ